ncbi:MAG: hypothetical protein LBQ38_00245 [Spirochaetaceae bacterium]|nr:hypothetical protein [Spirochaetaceae bacterium]
MKCIARLGGNDDTGAFFNAMNTRLANLASAPEKVFPIIAGGDPVTGLDKSGFSFINLSPDTDILRLTHSAYVYMASMVRLNIDVLSGYAAPEALLAAGGGGTVNDLYLQYRAAILNRPIYVVSAAEMGGIGAALCAANALKDEKTAAAFRQRQNFKVIQPDYKWGSLLRRQSDELLSFYRNMAEKKLLEILCQEPVGLQQK